ncbi:hypothetical protein CDL15_Pgr026729 [Punica granatum]|uniref:Reverse transcriptase zinc-binding domain-containing protein n=1 Tax=Punica granatum TaxID=22663 RepID=A0A218WMQ5_PUNGR|nr:hypothetical protein CDL15_Pgr026729 [Punica granatum]
MKAKYGSPLAPNQRTPASTSSIWKGLLWCRNTLQASTCFSIGNGSSTSAWHDPWIPGNPSFKPIPSIGIQVEPNTKVRDLMLFHPKRWNTPLLLNLFDQATVRNILKIHIPLEDYGDSIVWTPSSSGSHSVKSFYLLD